jgi:hypothetical protein
LNQFKHSFSLFQIEDYCFLPKDAPLTFITILPVLSQICKGGPSFLSIHSVSCFTFTVFGGAFSCIIVCDFRCLQDLSKLKFYICFSFFLITFVGFPRVRGKILIFSVTKTEILPN